MADYGGSNGQRFPCKVCGRQFFGESLAKHEDICAKNASKKRKVFDSSKQRVEGTDINLRQLKQSQKKVVAPPKTNWRAKHEDFINTVRAARGVSRAIADGGPLPPPPPPSINPDYIQCPYCSRRFSRQAADRHIGFCKEQSKRISSQPQPSVAAKAKQTTRLQYQPPKPKAKMSPAAASPASSTGSYRMPGPGTKTPSGQATRPGVRAPVPVPRGRAGSNQSIDPLVLFVTDAKQVRQRKNSTKDATKSAHDQVHFLSSTSTLRNTSSDALQHREFSLNPHRKLSSIKKRGPRGSVVGNTERPPTSVRSRESVQVSETGRCSGSFREDESTANSARQEQLDRDIEFDFCGKTHFQQNEDIPFHDRGDLCSSVFQPNSKNDFFHQDSDILSTNPTTVMSIFCHECGSNYPVETAKFCCICGTRRLSFS